MSNGFSDVVKAVDHIRSRRAAKYSNYALTELGKQKVEDADGAEGEVLNYLDERGASTLREIAVGVHFEEKRTKTILDNLMAKQRVMKVAR